MYIFPIGRNKFSNRKKKITISPELENILICQRRINYKFKSSQHNNESYMIELSKKPFIINSKNDIKNIAATKQSAKNSFPGFHLEKKYSIAKLNLSKETKKKSCSIKNTLVSKFDLYDLEMLRTQNLFNKIQVNPFSDYRNKISNCNRNHPPKFQKSNFFPKISNYKVIFANLVLKRINESIENYNCFGSKKKFHSKKQLSQYKIHSDKKPEKLKLNLNGKIN